MCARSRERLLNMIVYFVVYVNVRREVRRTNYVSTVLYRILFYI